MAQTTAFEAPTRPKTKDVMKDEQTPTKVTVKLSPRTMDALNQAAESGGLNRTDTINRAIQVYDYLLKRLDDEKGLTILTEDGRERLFLY